jgi:hypothetical protein
MSVVIQFGDCYRSVCFVKIWNLFSTGAEYGLLERGTYKLRVLGEYLYVRGLN